MIQDFIRFSEGFRVEFSAHHVRASGPKNQSLCLGLMVPLLLISQGPCFVQVSATFKVVQMAWGFGYRKRLQKNCSTLSASAPKTIGFSQLQATRKVDFMLGSTGCCIPAAIFAWRLGNPGHWRTWWKSTRAAQLQMDQCQIRRVFIEFKKLWFGPWPGCRIQLFP